MDSRDLLRGLARRLEHHPVLASVVTTHVDAVRLFMAVAHEGLCPGCDAGTWAPADTHHIDCARCGRLSVYRATGLQRRRVSVLHLLGAVFAVFVDTSTTSSRGFSRRNGLRLATSWKLLHDVREALPRVAPRPGIHAQVLGETSQANAADVVIAGEEGRVVCVDGLDAVYGFRPSPMRRELPLWLGRLRAWLTEVFRGVSAKHLWRYLAEFSARHGRVARGGASHI
ncbi:MAG: hypothetical protein Q8O67_31215 [Deltaproteobacteria bacterium]|nr:hypothetical protein [Deltaproteobacteria bacterium]